MKGLLRKIIVPCVVGLLVVAPGCSTTNLLDYGLSKATGMPYATTKAARQVGTAAAKHTQQAVKAHSKKAKRYASEQRSTRSAKRTLNMMQGGRNYSF